MLEKIRIVNIYILLFVAFMVGYGKIFEAEWGSLGKKPEPFLIIPLLLSIYLVIKIKNYRWSITYREKAFLLYALFVSLMPLWGLSFDKSMDAVRAFWSAALFAMLLTFNTKNEKELKLLLFSFLGGVILRGGFSLYEYFNGIDNLRASFRHYNVYGNFLLVPLSLLFALLIYDSNDKKRKILYAGFLIFLGCTLLATMSRAPVVALVISVVIFSIFLSRRALVLALIFPLIITLFIFAKPDSDISKRVTTIKWDDGSLLARKRHIWPAAIEIYKDHNLYWGIGSGNFKQLTIDEPKYRAIVENYKYAHAHNDFLAVLVSQGLIGAFFYLFFLVQILIISWRLFKTGNTHFLKALGAAGFLWIVAHALAGIVHHEYTSSRYNMSVAFIVTVVLVGYYISMNPVEEKK